MKKPLETVYKLLEIVEDRKKKDLSLSNLLIGDPNIDPPKSLLKALENSVFDGPNGYSPAKGDPHLIDAIISYDKVKANPSQLIIGNGSKTLVFIALKLLLQPNDKVCLFSPYYPAYQSLLLEFNAQITNLDYTRDYLNEIKKIKPKLVILTSPNNPDGQTFTKIQLQEISDLTKQLNSYFIIDEAYRNFIYDEEVSQDLSDFIYEDHVICLRTFSKALAICGWRIGYCIANTNLIKQMAQTQLSLFNPLNRIMQRALTKYLKNPDIGFNSKSKHIFKSRLNKVCSSFAKRNIKVSSPLGAFYIFLKLNLSDTQDFCIDLATNTGIILWPGYDFGKPSFIRISIAQLEESKIESLIERLTLYLKENKVNII
ncbi:MAG: pyridoxal phosphate-dependent aminotransferase [Candidatus Cloacimonetes bacterium]|nr:pyridoxal phosphate-dependent aminotransferase [Candidatus Cloacimonadota bacterium]